MVDDPAHYRWTSYRANGLGQASAILTPHPLYLALGQNQPLGNERFYAHIEKLTGQRRETKPQGRPRASGGDAAISEEQEKLEL